MMKRHARNGIILTILLLMMSTFYTLEAFASTCEGRLDSVVGDTVNGWAWDSSDEGTPVNVNITVTKYGGTEPVQEASVTANQYREELPAAGKGTGYCGFTAVIDWSELEPGLYTLDCTIAGQCKTNSLYYQNGQDTTVSADSLIPLGTFKTTAYCPCSSCCGSWGAHTSTGAIPAANHTISVDPRVIPYGSRVMINGIIYTAEDCGGGVKGRHIDIFFNTHGECRTYGVRPAEAFLIP